MAYSTGTATSLTDLYNQLVTFMTSNGWTLHDTVSATDKVLTSSGTSGNLSMTYRLSTSEDLASNPFKDPSDPHLNQKYILFRGYHNWNAGTNTGTNEYGAFGPWFFMGAQSANVGNYFAARFNDASLPFSPVGSTVSSYIFNATQITQSGGFDGKRKMYGNSNTNNATTLDFVTGDGFAGATTSGSTSLGITGNGNGCLVHDPTTDKDFFFLINANATVSLQWQRYDYELNLWQQMATPPWAVNGSGWVCVWDGGNFIYVHIGNASTGFYRYSISGNSWTTLTSSPANRVVAYRYNAGSGGCGKNAVYVPASVTGLGEDVIYMPLADSGTVIYRYDVTANAWRSTAGTGALTAPITLNSNTHMFFDRQRYIYFAQPATGSWALYRKDATAPGVATFATVGVLDEAGSRTTGAGDFINHLVSKLKSSNLYNTTYWFVGNADRVIMVTKVNSPTPHYYWTYIGKYNTYYTNTLRSVTSPVTAGFRATFNVSSSAGLVANDLLTVWDPSTGLTEQVVVYDVPTGTSFRANAANSYTTAAKVGVDVAQTCVTGDSGIACLPLGPKGYRFDFEADHYFQEGLFTPAQNARTSPSARGLYMPSPIHLQNPYSNISKQEYAGSLEGVSFLTKSTFPRPVSEDTITIAGQQYKVFAPYETSRNTGTNGDNRLIVIGPLV